MMLILIITSVGQTDVINFTNWSDNFFFRYKRTSTIENNVGINYLKVKSWERINILWQCYV